jgi:hypothetical protein
MVGGYWALIIFCEAQTLSHNTAHAYNKGYEIKIDTDVIQSTS